MTGSGRSASASHERAVIARGWKLEVAAALATAVGHLVTMQTGGHGAFIVIAVAGWITWVAGSARRRPAVLDEWGLSRAGFDGAWRTALPPGLFVLLFCLAWGFAAAHFPLPPHALLLVLLYPIWGVVQQLLVQGFVVRHVDALFAGRRRALTTFIGAAAFGVVHVPEYDLAAATFLFGLAATPIWLRHRNVWPLALWHGVLGVAFYYLVLGRDPWLENFGV